MKSRLFIADFRLLFEPRDLWVGLYWTKDRFTESWHFYICIVPMFPLKITIAK